jgi:hypothetical protein
MKCMIAPDSDGYNVSFGNSVTSTEVEGGKPRIRKDKLGAVSVVGVKWTLGPEDYDYLMAFHRSAIELGSLAFEIDLLFESSEVQEYENVTFVPGSLRLSGQKGRTYMVEASLNVPPKPVDEAADNILLGRNDTQ